jgi:hypothetical protein
LGAVVAIVNGVTTDDNARRKTILLTLQTILLLPLLLEALALLWEVLLLVEGKKVTA